MLSNIQCFQSEDSHVGPHRLKDSLMDAAAGACHATGDGEADLGVVELLDVGTLGFGSGDCGCLDD